MSTTTEHAKMSHEQEHGHHHKIRIRIDHKPYEAPKSIMTGLELRALAQPPIGQDYDLWLEKPGPTDDEKVGDAQEVHLHDGMHFYIAPRTINPGAGYGLA